MIHGVDSVKLLKEINKQGEKINKIISCLLQIHIAQEETKFGFDPAELDELFNDPNNLVELKNIRIAGFMGMASFSDQEELVREEFRMLNALFEKYQFPSFIKTPNFQPTILSMGMSNDYTIAVEEGSNMVRIGSLIFGNR